MKEFVVEHHIQREILRKLSRADNLRFSELKPDGMESNIFMYHLHQLRKNNCVVKTDNGYALGLNGLRYADNVTGLEFKIARHPKPLSIVVLTNKQGDLLMTYRHKQPYIHEYMFLSGKQHFGEDPQPHAQRELLEKTGLTGIHLTRRGLADYRIRDQHNEVITHIIGHVYSGEYNGGIPEQVNPDYSFMWCKPKDLPKLKLLPGTYELYQELLKHPDELFFASADFTDD